MASIRQLKIKLGQLHLRGAWILFISCWVTACNRRDAVPANQTTNNDAAPKPKLFQMHGVVKELASDGKTIVIRHEEVTNFMPAMTMPFEVKDRAQLNSIHAGDYVEFEMAVGNDDAWITRIHPAKASQPMTNGSVPKISAELQKQNAAVRLVRDVEPLSIGDALPEYHFTNELGRMISTKDFQGQAFAFTFFFTRCPMPNFCPKLSVNFLETQNLLKTNRLAPSNWHLFSISFDTTNDTPAQLLEYARHHEYDPARWSFLTGDLLDINAIADQFGEEFGHDEGGGITHKLRTVVVDSKGRIHKILTNNEWSGKDLVRELIEASR